MELQEAVNYFKEFLTHKELARVLGVSTSQLSKYLSGETTSCSDKVVDRFYDLFKVEGSKVLINYFNSETNYLDMRALRES